MSYCHLTIKKHLEVGNLFECAGFSPFSLRKQAKTWQRLVVLVVNFLSFPSLSSGLIYLIIGANFQSAPCLLFCF